MTHDALSVRPILWTLHEAACHLAGEVPAADMEAARRQVLGENATSKAGQIFRLLKDARIDGASEIIQLPGGWVGHDRIRPTDAIAFAQVWGLTVPSACFAVATTNPEPCAGNERELTVVIRGREALPVRAIPYITVGMIGPDEVAQTLAGKADPAEAQFGDAPAYHVRGGAPVPMLPKEWDAVVRRLDAFKSELRAKYPSKDYDARRGSSWEDQAALLLPAGVFVWRDEFERDYASPDRPGYTAKRKGDRDLLLAPTRADDVRAAILEGFAVDEVAPKVFGYTIEGAAKAIAEKYDVPERKLRDSIFEAAAKGELIVRDPQTGLPYTPKLRRDFWEVISPSDANAWLEKQGVGYRLDPLPKSGDRDLSSVMAPPASAPKTGDDGASSTCAVFREMVGLRPDEVTIEFAAGESGGAVLNIIARGQRKRVTAQDFGLFDRRKAESNVSAGLLLGMAQGLKPKHASSRDSKRVSRLRDVLKKHLGISADPFAPYSENRGYLPRFTVLDKRDAAKERAEREANRKTDPLDSPKVMARVDQQQAEEHQREERDDLEDDPAAKWLSEHDSSR
jgi:hypothetical protein